MARTDLDPFVVDPSVVDLGDPTWQRVFRTMRDAPIVVRWPVTTPIERVLEEMTRRIVDRFAPRAIILFGSKARGNAHEDSDVDLLIVFDGRPDKRGMAVRIAQALFELGRATDIIVTSPSEIARERGDTTSLITVAVAQGKHLYDRPGADTQHAKVAPQISS